MGWDKRNRRWRIMHEGARHVVSCRQLSVWAGKPVPETKEGSYQIANAWWAAKLAEIEGQRPPHPAARYLAQLALRNEWAKRNGQRALASMLKAEINRIEAGGRPAYMDEYSSAWEPDNILELYRTHPEVDDDEAWPAIDPDDAVWNDRVRRDCLKPAPADTTIKGLVDRYLGLEHARVQAGDLSPSEYDVTRLCLEHFSGWIGKATPAANIDANVWEDFYKHVLKSDVSVEYRKKRFRHARNFIEWLTSKGVIPQPPNLFRRKYRFESSVKAVPTMTTAEVWC
jgi:hypothetical protein